MKFGTPSLKRVPLGTRQASRSWPDKQKNNMGKISSTGEVTGAGGDWVEVEVGMHDAICCDWYIIPEYNAKGYGVQERVAINFMVSGRTPDDQPMTIRKTYNNTTAPKGNLVKALNSWKDGPIDMSKFKFDKLLGVKATIMVDDFTDEANGNKVVYVSKIKPPKESNELKIDPTIKRMVMVKVDGEPNEGCEHKWELVPRDEAPAAAPAPLPTPESIATRQPAPAPVKKDDDVPF